MPATRQHAERDSERVARALVWFRRDLRDFDHAALDHALTCAETVYCAFVFDRDILDALPARADRRVEFIRESLVLLDAALRARGGGLVVRHARARDAIAAVAHELGVQLVCANEDYEPAARERDDAVRHALAQRGIAFHACKDHVIFAKSELLARSGRPFTVFTPYRAAWLATLAPAHLAAHRRDRYDGRLAPPPAGLDAGVPSLEAIGFVATDLRALGIAPGMAGGAARLADFRERVDDYDTARNFPGIKGPSYLSVHLRFGTVSIRELAAWAHARSLMPGGRGAATWLSELIWRDFFAQVLWHHPHAVDGALRREYDALAFDDDPVLFAAWCEGRTGYPFVDAAMRQLNGTGYMHNRLRMVSASFLVKDLLVDWRRGERYFARMLLDYDLASNNGGWQWAASTGCDAQPWFRIFNPVLQSQRFDPDGRFIRRYVPELARLDDKAIHAPWQASAAALQAAGVTLGRDYPARIVDHAAARARALERYKAVRR